MTKPRILVVEDEAIVAMDIQRRLSLLGYEVAGVAINSEAAMAMAQSTSPQLVLMDIRLQGPIDGIAAAIKIHQRFRLPVVFLTAYAEEATIEQAKRAEPFGYILKPFEDRELKTVIEMALYKHHAEEEIQHVNRLYAMLSQTNQTIARSSTRDELFPSICRIAVEHGNFKAALIGWLDPNSHRLKTIAQWGNNHGCLYQEAAASVPMPEYLDPVGTAIREGRPGICNDVLDDRCLGHWSGTEDGLDFRGVAAVPFRAQQKVCGVLCVYASEPGFFGDREVCLLDEIALDISFALDNLEREACRRQAEQTALAAERQWRTTFDAIGDGVCLIDTEGRILRANRAMSILLNQDHHALAGKMCFEVVHDTTQPIANCPLDRMKVSHRRESMILQHGEQWVEVVVDPILDEAGQLLGAVHILIDITERKKVELERLELQAQLIQAQKMEAVGQLAGGVAHDFNNILTAVLMHLNLLQDDTNLSPEVRNGLAELVVEAKRAANLTRQLLMFSRRQVLNQQHLELNALLGNFLKMLRRLIGEQITLEFSGAPGDLWLEADPGMLEQVVMNLLVNARDAMPKGGRVTIKTQFVEIDESMCRNHSEARPGAFVCCAVSDTGCGMEEVVKEHIFEPFFTTKEYGKGTGLGLATVYGIIKQHQGWIDVFSELGQGSTFTIYLPAKSHAPAAPAASTLLASIRGGTESLLLVEDEDSVRRTTAALLRQLGYQVTVAGAGPEALQAWQTAGGNIDLVITDVVMPGGITGLELSEQLLKLKPSLKVVLISGYSTTLVDEGIPQHEGFSFLQKPFEAVTLAKIVRDCLDSTKG